MNFSSIKSFIKSIFIKNALKDIEEGKIKKIDFKKITEKERRELEKEVIKLYKETDLNIYDIAFKVGCSNKTIRNILNKAGIERNKFKSNTILKEEVLKLAKTTTLNTQSIGYKVGCSEETVRKILKEAGVKTLLQEKRIEEKEAKKENIIELYTNSNLSIKNIATELKTSPKTIYKALEEAGVTKKEVLERKQKLIKENKKGGAKNEKKK